MSILCVIPARGGSKGLPGKNLRTVAGISLVGRAVLAAFEFLDTLGRAGRVVVDTDSEAIAAEARLWGADVPFLRPAALAADDTPTTASVREVVRRLADAGEHSEAVVLLQPTSPLRTGADILNCWRAYDATTAPSVNAVTPVEHPPELALELGAGGLLEWRDVEHGGAWRRQEFRTAYRLTGSVYITTPELLERRGAFTLPGVTRGVVVPWERAMDIDSNADLEVARAIANAADVRPLRVAEREIGREASCFVIAEAGVNHNGDVGQACELVDLAADAGADAVKFQIFDPEKLVSRAAPMAVYQRVNTGSDDSQLEMLRALTLPHEEFRALAERARDRDILFLATAFDADSADFLEDLGVAAFKVPSGELTNHRLLAHLAAKGLPLLISTGMATLPEVAEAVRAVRRAGDPPLALFHCVSDYPAAPEDCNLRAMTTMRAAFGVPTGWSDHTRGTEISLAAVAMGAELLEKHFTLDRSLPGPDHAASLEPVELRELVSLVRAVEAARGDGEKQPVAAERAIAAVVRRSVHAALDLPAGHRLAESDLELLRPGTGISAAEMSALLGRVLARALARGEIIARDALE